MFCDDGLSAASFEFGSKLGCGESRPLHDKDRLTRQTEHDTTRRVRNNRNAKGPPRSEDP